MCSKALWKDVKRVLPRSTLAAFPSCQTTIDTSTTGTFKMAARIPLEQTGTNVALNVTNVAQPLLNNFTLIQMIQSWIITNFNSNVNSIWWGFGPNVTTLTGNEVTPGSSPLITIEQIRQLYELQDPMRMDAQANACQQPLDMKIPVIAFNFQNIYFITNVAGPIECSACIFNNVYV